MIWALTRSFLETDNYKHRRHRRRSRSHWTLFETLSHIFGLFLRIIGVYQRGYFNARNVVLREVEIDHARLPESFHGYRILHLSDLHLDSIRGIEEIICERIENLDCDLCVLTGDYRRKTHGGFRQIIRPLKRISMAVNARDGILAILGNHDTYLMVNPMEDMGIRVLANETVTIFRENERVAVTGIDDPHYYYTDQAVSSMEEDMEGFKILLVHSPELYDVAADNDYSLYLCGHTHGGQICLPGGIPLITHLYNGRKFYRGLWRYSGMKGITNQGCGVVSIPLRFNSESEILLITLKSLTGKNR
ncbi:MAG: metallophosphoesterase [Thermodesulfobacteriota bacterium]